jgi:hypothetical protein
VIVLRILAICIQSVLLLTTSSDANASQAAADSTAKSDTSDKTNWASFDDAAIVPTVYRVCAAREGDDVATATLGSEVSVEVRGLGQWLKGQILQANPPPELQKLKDKYAGYLTDKDKKLDPSKIEEWKNDVNAVIPHLCVYVRYVPFPEIKMVSYAEKTTGDDQIIDSTGYPTTVIQYAFSRPNTADYSLEKAEDINRRWNDLTHYTFDATDYKTTWFAKAQVNVKVGFDDGDYGGGVMSSSINPDKGDSTKASTYFYMRPFSDIWMVLSFAIIAALVVFCIGFGYATNILRDTTMPKRPGFDGADCYPFSLSLCQIAFWTVTVIAAFIFIGLSTNNFNCVNATAVTLLGISATSGLGAAFVNKNSTTRGTAYTQEMKDYYNRWKYASFLIDLFCERETMSFHRFQLICWTTLLGGVFVCSTYAAISMPTFDSTLLILVGVVNCTYVALKVPSQT